MPRSAASAEATIADAPVDIIISDPLVIALQWLALNRARPREIAGSASP